MKNRLSIGILAALILLAGCFGCAPKPLKLPEVDAALSETIIVTRNGWDRDILPSSGAEVKEFIGSELADCKPIKAYKSWDEVFPDGNAYGSPNTVQLLYPNDSSVIIQCYLLDKGYIHITDQTGLTEEEHIYLVDFNWLSNFIETVTEMVEKSPDELRADDTSDLSASYPEQAAEYLRQCLDGSALVYVNRAKDTGQSVFPGVNYSGARLSPNGNKILCKTDANGAGEARWSGYLVISLNTNPKEIYPFDGEQWGFQDHVFLSDELIGFASGGVIGGQEDTWESVRLFDSQYNPLNTRLDFPGSADAQIVGIGYDSGSGRYVLAYAQNSADGQDIAFSRNRLCLALFESDGAFVEEHMLSEEYMSPYSPNLLSLLPNNPLVTSDGRILIPVLNAEDPSAKKLLVINTADWSLQELPYGESLRLSADGGRAFAVSYDEQGAPLPVILDFKDRNDTAVTELPNTLWEAEGYPGRFYPYDAVMRDRHVYIMAANYTADGDLFCGLFYWNGEQSELLQIFPGSDYCNLAGVSNEGNCCVMLRGICGDEYADRRDYIKDLIG